MNIFKRTIHFFDILEDKVRVRLSRHPIIYAFIGGISIVLFWRGVWMTADMYPFMTGPHTLIGSTLVLLITGLFVSFFVGDIILISGLRGEKKIVERADMEIKTDRDLIKEVRNEVRELHREVVELRAQRESKK